MPLAPNVQAEAVHSQKISNPPRKFDDWLIIKLRRRAKFFAVQTPRLRPVHLCQELFITLFQLDKFAELSGSKFHAERPSQFVTEYTNEGLRRREVQRLHEIHALIIAAAAMPSLAELPLRNVLEAVGKCFELFVPHAKTKRLCPGPPYTATMAWVAGAGATA